MRFVAALLLALTLSAFGQIPQETKPYLLPHDHHLKPALDILFGESRATFSDKSMQKAGFKILFSKSHSFIRVARHPQLPGHLIKANLDSVLMVKRETPAWKWFVRRCQCAQKIQSIIESQNIIHFQVPRKWIYPLPKNPPTKYGIRVIRHPVVLLVEDMKLVSKEENLKAWKLQITPRHLDELYIIIQKAGSLSYRPDNIWLSQNGKFSFIDTEYYPAHVYRLEKIKRYLSPENQKYWQQLIKQGGPRAR